MTAAAESITRPLAPPATPALPGGLRTGDELVRALARAKAGSLIELHADFMMDADEPLRIDVPGVRIVGSCADGGERRSTFMGFDGNSIVVAARAVELRNLAFRGGRSSVYCEEPGLTIADCSFWNVRRAVTVFTSGLTRFWNTMMRGGELGISVTGGGLVASGLVLSAVDTGIVYQGAALLVEDVVANCRHVAVKLRDVANGSAIMRSTLEGGLRAVQLDVRDDEESSITLRTVYLAAGMTRGSAAIGVRSHGRAEVFVEASRVDAEPRATEGSAIALAGGGSIEVSLSGTAVWGGSAGVVNVDCADARVTYDPACEFDAVATLIAGKLI